MKKFVQTKKLNAKGQELLDLYETYMSDVKPAVKAATRDALMKEKSRVVADALRTGISVKGFEMLLYSTFAYLETDFSVDASKFIEDILKDYNLKYTTEPRGMSRDTIRIQHHVMARCSDMERIFGLSKYQAQTWYRTGVTDTIVHNFYGKALQNYVEQRKHMLSDDVFVSVVYDKNNERNMCLASLCCEVKLYNLTEEVVRAIGDFFADIEDIHIDVKL